MDHNYANISIQDYLTEDDSHDENQEISEDSCATQNPRPPWFSEFLKWMGLFQMLISFFMIVQTSINATVKNVTVRRKRSSLYWEDEVKDMTDREFKQDFRMTRRTFNSLVTAIKSKMSLTSTNILEPMTAEKRIAIGLYTLASAAEYRVIATVFGVSKATVMRCFKSFVYAVTNSNLKNSVKVPSKEEFIEIAKIFRSKTGYVNACGAIDGTHFRIKVPIHLKNDYYDHHEDISILTLAICDADYRIWWIKTGVPGRSNDAGAFLETNLYQNLENGTILPNSDWTIGSTRIPYHLLGDSAFRETNWLLKPFKQQAYPPGHEYSFNKRHSRARVTIEHSFGRLKGRFRRLLKDPFECKLEDVPTVITSAVILHNLCELSNDEFYNEWNVTGTNVTLTRDRSARGEVNFKTVLADFYFQEDQISQNISNAT